VFKEAKRIDPDAVVILLTSGASFLEPIRSESCDYLERSKDNPWELAEAVYLAIEKRALRLQECFVVETQGSKRPIHARPLRERFSLHEREMDVVKLLCGGATDKDLAEILFISERTLKGYLHNIFQKMGVQNRAALICKVLADPS